MRKVPPKRKPEWARRRSPLFSRDEAICFRLAVPKFEGHLNAAHKAGKTNPDGALVRDRPAPATPWLASALLHRPVALGVALPNLAAGPRRHGAGQTGNRRPVASQRLPTLLAARSRHLGRPSMNREVGDLIRQMSQANPLWGAPASTASCSSSASTSARPRSADTCRGGPRPPPRPGARSCTTTGMTPPPSTCSLS